MRDLTGDTAGGEFVGGEPSGSMTREVHHDRAAYREGTRLPDDPLSPEVLNGVVVHADFLENLVGVFAQPGWGRA